MGVEDIPLSVRQRPLSPPSVSAIVPFYNAAKTLRRCLDSILGQTPPPSEVLLINDGSTDHSEEIALSYCKQFSKVKLLKQSNAGAAAARNLGLREAQGEFIQFVDADDEVHPCFLNVMIPLILDADCALCGYHRISKSGREIERFQSAACTISSPTDWENRFGTLYQRYLLSSVCNKLYRRSIIAAGTLQFDPAFPIGEDLLFNLTYLSQCHRVAITDQILYTYFYTGESSLTAVRLLEKPEIDRFLFRSAQKFCEQIGISPSRAITVIYLKNCFTNIEKAVFPKLILSKAQISQDIERILDCEETKIALSISLQKNREAQLYQVLLGTRSKRILRLSAWLRGWVKSLLQR